MVLWIIPVAILGLGILISCAIWLAFVDIQPSKGSSRDKPSQVPTEDVTIPIRHGYVTGRIFQSQSPKGWLVISHNWGSSKNRYYKIAGWIADQLNIDVLCYDLRGHGASSKGRSIFWIFGLVRTYQHDLHEIIEWGKTQKRWQDLPIHLMGYSIGASISLEESKVNPGVKSLICDSGPFPLDFPIISMLIDRAIGEKSKAWKTWCSTLFYFSVNYPKTVQIPAGLEKCQTKKLLLIEAGKDTFIHSKGIKALSKNWPGPKEHWILQETQHLMNYSKHPKTYEEKLKNHFQS